jgi:hypothetical protein
MVTGLRHLNALMAEWLATGSTSASTSRHTANGLLEEPSGVPDSAVSRDQGDAGAAHLPGLGRDAQRRREFVRTYPLNLEPIIVDSKISKGQLKAYSGAVKTGTGPGRDRGGIFWNGLLYRVMGTKFCSIDAEGVVTQIGDVGDGARCWFDYSFDRLAVGSGTSLYYYSVDTGLTLVVDEDLGPVVDGIWIDGYFMTTDGTYVIVTELSDPTSIVPLKYGSAEEDPDPVTGLIKYRDEPYVLGRYTTQVLDNVGGNGFPFVNRSGAGFPFGCVGPTAKSLFGDGFAFVGSARNQGLNVYLAGQGTAEPIGSRELCDALDALPDPSVVEAESRSSRSEHRLLIHLPTETWVFLLKASEAAGEPVWFKLKSDQNGYRCRNNVEAYGQSIVGDVINGDFGYLTSLEGDHLGVASPEWGFGAGLVYNEGVGAIIHSLELVGLPGRGGNGAVFMSLSRDGETWTQERAVQLRQGGRSRRIAWRPHARVGNYLGMRFRGTGTALPGIASLEAKLAPLTS